MTGSKWNKNSQSMDDQGLFLFIITIEKTQK